MTLALSGRTARSIPRTHGRWKIHLVVPHAGTSHHGYDDILVGRGVTRPQIQNAFDHARYNVDQGANELANKVATRVRQAGLPNVSAVNVHFFDLARIYCDAGRLWGITREAATAHVHTLSLPYTIVDGIRAEQLPRKMITSIQARYQAYMTSIARSIASNRSNHLFIEIHSFDQFARRNDPASIRPPIAIMYREEHVATQRSVSPLFTNTGIASTLTFDTCAVDVHEALDQALDDALPDIQAAHNFPPYNLPVGNLSVRAAYWKYLNERYKIPPELFWRFPIMHNGAIEAFPDVRTFGKRRQPVTTTFEALAIEMRKDLIIDPTHQEGFTQAIANTIISMAKNA